MGNDVVANVTGRWHENLVNHVDDPVGCGNIRTGHVSSTHTHDAVGDREGCFISIYHGDCKAVCDC